MISFSSMPNSADFFIILRRLDIGILKQVLHFVEAIKKSYKSLDVAEIQYMANNMVSKDRRVY